jgi:hypothetical protein
VGGRAVGDLNVPDLEVMSSAGSARVGESVLVMVTRHAAVSRSSVTVLAESPASMTLVERNGACSSSEAGLHSLIVAADLPNPLVVCLWSAKSVRTRVLVSATGTDGAIHAAQSDAIDFTETSIGNNPVLMALLSATIGFVLGLGSTWYSAFTEAWRNKQKARADTQQFIVETLFPEIREHAKAIETYLTAPPAQRRTLAVKTLAATAGTEAYSQARLSRLSDYFAYLRKKTLQERLSVYDKVANEFNDEADRLNRQVPDARDTSNQDAIATKLRTLLKAMGFVDGD